MRRFAYISASMACIMAITSIDVIAFASAAHAKSKNNSAPSRSAFKPSTQRFSPKVHRVQPRFIQKQIVAKPFLQKRVPFVAKKSVVSPLAQQILVRKNLPLFKPALNSGPLKGRLTLPQNIQPKVTLVKAPKALLAPRFSPFVQRHWKKAFFWVAVAGIGYVTIPEYYYDRWLAYVDEDEPDYDNALTLLSLAALDEEEGVVRVSKPADVPYRYSAPVGPTKVAAPQDTTDPNSRATADAGSCTMKPFVDRQWSQPYSWVQIPEVGNVTVPDQTYDRFIGFMAGEPPNYTNACTVLAEAAAGDTVSPAEASSVN